MCSKAKESINIGRIYTRQTGSTCHSLRSVNQTSVDKNETENENNFRFNERLKVMIGRTKKRIVGKIIWGPRKSHLKENGAVSNVLPTNYHLKAE